MKLVYRDIYPVCISSHTATAVLLQVLFLIKRLEIYLTSELRTDLSVQLQAKPGVKIKLVIGHIMILPGHLLLKHLKRN